MDSKIKIRMCELVTDGLQTRHELNHEAVADYTENYRNGTAMPPVSVVRNPETGEYYLVDGFHRMTAASFAELEEIEAVVVAEGDYTAALKLALTANQTNGLRRTNADKRAALEIAWANREALFGTKEPKCRDVADMCGISHPTVLNFLKKPLVKFTKEDSESGNETTEARSVKKLLKEGKDRFGQIIPVQIIPAFHLGTIRGFGRDSRDLYARVKKARDNHDMSLVKLLAQDIQNIKNFSDHTRFAEAYCVCPLCNGDGCHNCDHLGWMNREQYNRLPPERKPKAN